MAVASRREAILGEATALFRRHGFGGVGIDEIGAAAGIAGPAVYRHFDNKEELLAAAIGRAGAQLAASAAAALASPDDAVALQQLNVSGQWCGAWLAPGQNHRYHGLSGSVCLESRIIRSAWSARSFDRW